MTVVVLLALALLALLDGAVFEALGIAVFAVVVGLVLARSRRGGRWWLIRL